MSKIDDTILDNLKLCLARYSAKEKAIVSSINQMIEKEQTALEELSSFSPSAYRSSSYCMLEHSIKVMKNILAKIETPADLYMTDYEMRGCR